jgi:predicted dehydrogenase
VTDRLRAVLIGAGSRGHGVFGRWALDHADDIAFVGVAEPDPGRRARFGAAHAIPEEYRFTDVAALGAARLDATAAIIASPDRSHAADAIGLLEAGYDVLLEKPLAVTSDELAMLVRYTRTAPGRLSVAHVLRYTPFFRALHDVVSSGRLGDVVSVVHSEIIAWWHMAHSYVRGNWAVAETSSPLILAKCCHDLDILTWNLPAPVTRVASSGGLHHFRPEHAPPGATPRCTDGCPVSDCIFDARRIYLASDTEPWLIDALTDDTDAEAPLRALRSGPYGRCVYRAGSNVVDHQVVAMRRADGTTTTLRFSGHGDAGARTMRYDGTRATLRGVFGTEASLEIRQHGGAVETIEVAAPESGHGGGDDGLMRAFVSRARDRLPLPTDIESAVESHLLAFAAEEARLGDRVIDMDRFRNLSL